MSLKRHVHRSEIIGLYGSLDGGVVHSGKRFLVEHAGCADNIVDASSLLVRLGKCTCHVLALSHVDAVLGTRVREYAGAALLQHFHDVLADAVAASEYHSHLVTEQVADVRYVLRLRILQLEKLVEHVCVLTIGELHVALLASNHEDRLVRILAHYATVVRCLELRVLEGTLVSVGDELTVERLRSLSAAKLGAVWNRRDIALVVHLNDSVGRRNGNVDGTMVLKRVNDVVKDALADKRAHGIVEDEVDVLVLIGADGRQRRVVTLLTALKNLLHLAPLVSQDDILEVADEHRIRDDGNLVNARITLKDIDSVLHYHLTSHLEELLWCGHAETFSYATGKYNGYVSFHCIGFWDVKYI